MKARAHAVEALLSATLLATHAAHAQRLTNGTRAQCTDAAAQSDLRRVPGYLRSDAADSAPAVESAADLLVDNLGQRLRASLGAPPGTLPVAEPTLTRSNIDGSLLVTLYRDGHAVAVIPTAGSSEDSLRMAGMRTLASLLKKSSDEGDRFLWPDKAEGDSASFHIHFEVPGPHWNGSQEQPDSGFVVAVFTIDVPWENPVGVKKSVSPKYPTQNSANSITGLVHLTFVVDTTGLAIDSTIRDFLPRGYAPPTPFLTMYYRDFAAAAKNAVIKSRYVPAVIASCRFPRRVVQPFEFRMH